MLDIVFTSHLIKHCQKSTQTREEKSFKMKRDEGINHSHRSRLYKTMLSANASGLTL